MGEGEEVQLQHTVLGEQVVVRTVSEPQVLIVQLQVGGERTSELVVVEHSGV